MEDTPTPAVNEKSHHLRFERTLRFMQQALPPPARLLDLGAPNPLSRLMQHQGYEVYNTAGDLDDVPEDVCGYEVQAVCAFEILEHLVGPVNVLHQIDAPRLFASIPLRLWFAPAYRNPTDPWDRHFHEFEPWQFDWLLEKAGWRIVRSEKWTSPPPLWKVGLRPLLRRITPRYYIVEAVKVPQAQKTDRPPQRNQRTARHKIRSREDSF